MGVFSGGGTAMVERPNVFASSSTAGSGSGIFAPSFGGTQPAEPETPQFGVGAPGSVEDTAINYGATPLGQYMAAKQQQEMINAGFPPGTDPGVLNDPETQRAANEAALAKIATANPELAQELTQRMTGAADTDKSFFDQMKELAGDVLHPVLAIGGKALDILGRPAQIIPELIVDEENDPWYEDIGQALSGNSKARGSDVMEKWGVENGLAKGLLGFAFDVAADPLTWATFGTAGVGRAVAAQAAGRTIAEDVVTKGLRGYAKYASKSDDDIARIANEVGLRLIDTSIVGADALPAMVARGIDVPEELLTEAVTRAQRAASSTLRGQRLRKMIPEEDIAALEVARMQGGLAGRAAAGAIGGVRFRAGVPFSKTARWTSAALPLTDRLGFRVFGNFFRGTSGLTRLELAVRRMAPEQADELIRTYVKDGFKGIRDLNPKLMQELGGGSFNLGSRFMELSHQMGRVTGYLSPHAAQYRIEGLAGIAAHNARRMAEGTRDQVYEDSLTLWKVDEDGPNSGIEMNRAQVEKSLRPLRNATRWDDLIDWWESGMTDEYAKLSDDELREMFTTNARVYRDTAIERAAGNQAKTAEAIQQYADNLELADIRISRMRAAHGKLSTEEQKAAEVYRRLLKQTMVDGDKRGVSALDRTVGYDLADRLNSADMGRYLATGRRDLAKAEVYMDLGGNPSVRDDLVTDTDYGRGYAFSTRKKTPGRWEKNPYAEGVDEVDINVLEQYQEFNRGDPGLALSDVTKLKEDILENGLNEPLMLEYTKGGKALLTEGNHRLEAARQLVAEGHTEFATLPVRTILASDLPKGRAFEPTETLRDLDEFGYIIARKGRSTDLKPSELSNLFAGGQRVGVRLQNPAIIRKGRAGSDEPAWREAYDSVLDDLNAEGRRDGEVLANPDLNLEDDEVWEEFTKRTATELATQRMKLQGFDGVVEYDEAGNLVRGVAFTQDNLIPVKVYDDTVGTVAADQGYYPHAWTETARASRQGDRSSKRFHGAAEFVHEQGRTSDLNFHQLNDRMRSELGLAEGQDALIRDPLQMLDLYSRRFANEAAQAQVNAAGRSLHSMYGVTGATKTVNTYRATKGFSPSLYRQLDTAQKRAYDKVIKRTLRELEAEERAARGLVADKVKLESDLILREGRGGFAAAARAAQGAARDEGARLGKDLRLALTKRASLRKAMREGKGDTSKVADDLQAVERRVEVLMAERKRLTKGGMELSSPEAVGRAQARLAEQAEKAASKIAKRATQSEKQIAKIRREVESAWNEVDKVRTRIQTKMAEMQPAVVPVKGNKAGYVSMAGVKGLEDLAMHPHLAAEFTEALSGMKDIGQLRKAWREWVQGPWKRWATVYYPGFHARNNMGAWFNNFLGGVTPGDYMTSYRISRALQNAEKYYDTVIPRKLMREMNMEYEFGMTYGQLGDHIHTLGVRGSNSQGLADTGRSINEWARIQKGQRSRTGRAVEKVGDRVPYGRAARATTEITENFHRQAAFIAGLRQSRGSWSGARMFTMLRHGDYEDLNDFEQGIKDLIPFYKWMRTNIPYQIHNLFEAPGKQLAVLKARDAAYVAQGQDPDEEMRKQPKWLQEAFTIPLPVGGDEGTRLLSLDLPMSDLYQGATDYVSAFLPVIRPFIESNVIHQNIFTGAPLEGKRVPLASWASLPGIKQVMAPFIETDAEGNPVIDDKVQNMMSAIPVFSRFRNWVFADEKSVSKRSSAVASALFGLRFTNQGPEQLHAQELAFYYNEILPEVEGLKNLGVPLPEPSMVSPLVFQYLGFEPPAPEEGETSA